MPLVIDIPPGAGAAGVAAALARVERSGRLETIVDLAEADVTAALAAAGFVRERDVIEMTIDIDPASPRPAPPAGVTLRRYDDARDARAVHDCLVAAFAGGHERVMPFDRWHPWLVGDASYDPGVVVVGEAGDGVAGVAQCWTEGWVKDLAVRPEHRRRGLGEALLREAFAEFAARGVRAVGLKVDADNPAGAARLYRRVGMRELRRHGMFARP